jgi:hypothetical protein
MTFSGSFNAILLKKIATVARLITDKDNQFAHFKTIWFNFFRENENQQFFCFQVSSESVNFIGEILPVAFNTELDMSPSYLFGIDANKFCDLVKNLKEDTIRFELDEAGNIFTITTTNGKYNFQLVDTTNMLNWQDLINVDSLKFEETDVSLINKMILAKSFVSAGSPNPADCGVYFGAGKIAATYSYSGVVFPFSSDFTLSGTISPNFINPFKQFELVLEVNKFLIALDDNYIIVKSQSGDSNFFLTGRLLAGEFRDYFISMINKTLAKESEFNSLVLPKTMWSDAISRLVPFTQEKRLILESSTKGLIFRTEQAFETVAEWKEDTPVKEFLVTVELEQVNKLFNIGDTLKLVFPTVASHKEYRVIAVEISNGETKLGDGFLMRFE